MITIKTLKNTEDFNFKIIDMYSLNCDYFVEEFSSIEELINYVEQVEMDPSYEITLNGKGTGEYASDLVSFCEDDSWKMDRIKN